MTEFELSVDADRSAIDVLLDWLAHACQQLGLATDDARRIAIVVEELFLNLVNHGYAGTGGAAIHYRLRRLVDQSLELEQQDQAAVFDISQAAPQTATMDRVGGLGIALIHGMSQSVRYRSTGNVNVTTIRFQVDTQPSNNPA